jgi:type I restriction enzyme M protein
VEPKATEHMAEIIELIQRLLIKGFAYEELLKRDKVNLDIFWLKDESLEESANLPAPDLIALEITDDLEAALEQFRTITDDLKS